MTVYDNMAYALKLAGHSRGEIKEMVEKAADKLELTKYLDRLPKALSGGQRQRVAIGRAIVRDPKVFLFDEPLSNLDAALRVQMRMEIAQLNESLPETTFIYVTHDQVEAMTLADRTAVMKGGSIQQLGTPDEIYNRPDTRYVADFIGSPSMNFLEGVVDAGSFRVGDVTIPMGGYGFAGPASGKAWFGIRPEHVAVGVATAGLPLSAEIVTEIVEPMGADTLVWTTFSGQPIRFRVDGGTPVRAGERMTIGFDPARASLFDHESEERL
jgi:multiple sugar transport system ATP-binding protein